jgi:hypothetical protein
VKLIYTNISEVSKSIRKKARSGRAVRFGPQDLELINEDRTIRAYFEQVRYVHFYEMIQGYNAKRLSSSPSILLGLA